MSKKGFRRLMAIVCAMMLLLTACAGSVGLFIAKEERTKPVIRENETPETNRFSTPRPSAKAPQPSATAAPLPQDTEPETGDAPETTPPPENTAGDLPEDVPEDVPEDNDLSEAPEVWTPIETQPLDTSVQAELPEALPDFYIAEKMERYLTFAGNYPELPFDTVVAYVNAEVDIPHYTDTITIDDPNNILVMCNKTYCLSPEYEPDDLVPIAGNKWVTLRAEAAEQWDKLYNDMREAGLRVYPRTAYRSYSTQKGIYRNYAAKNGADRADTFSARAGHSEHQTGLTLDMLHGTGFSSLGGAHFENTAHYAWLIENAADYGYILRYPKGYEHITGYRYEPWHWRYVGIEAAQRMKAENIATWEEYCGRYVLIAAVS